MQVLEKEDRSFQNFIEGIKSEATKKVYLKAYNLFLKFTNRKKINLKTVESDLQRWIISLKKQGSSYHYIYLNLSAISTFCMLNDVIINKKKLNKYIPAKQLTQRDRGYTIQEIQKLLSVCDLRFKLIVYLMSSTGIRLGALPQLRMKHLTKLDSFYQFVIYANTPEEYITFCTPECSEVIDTYLEYRKRCGEDITPESFLIREQFNHKRPNNPKQMTTYNISVTLTAYAQNAGLRTTDKVNGVRARKEVKLLHGFRKFFITTCMDAEMNPDIRQLITGRKTALGVEWFYYRPNIAKMIAEYEKVIPLLTINEENRLKQEVREYRIRADKVDGILLQIEEMKKKLGLS